MTDYRLLFVTILFACFISGCFDDPARNHPLDPLGENFLDEGRIAIRVTNFYPPRSGLDGVAVTVTPLAITGTTDATGEYITPRLPGGTYTVAVEEIGYAMLDTLIQVSAGETKSVALPLAGLPTFINFEINSVHVSRWFPPPEELFSLEISAELDDNDGVADIDSLWVTIEKYEYSQMLFVQPEPGKFIQSIPSVELPIGIVAMLGQEIRLKAKDRSGLNNISEPERLIRVITETPLALTPEGLEPLTNPQPTFSWEPLTLAFPYSFRLDIVRIDQNLQSIIQTVENIPASTTSIQAPAPLAFGEYFWTISVVDEFGNRSRSREAGFRIE